MNVSGFYRVVVSLTYLEIYRVNIPNNGTSIKTGIWLHIRQKLMSTLVVWSIGIVSTTLFIFLKKSIFCAWSNLRHSKQIFCHFCIHGLYKSIRQSMLITNITLFFNISRVIRNISGIFETLKNQFCPKISWVPCVWSIDIRLRVAKSKF